MAEFSKILLSGSTDGQGISITATTPGGGTVIHTAVSGPTPGSYDEVWAYAYSTVTTTAQLNMSIGPTTNTGSRWSYTVSAGDPAGLHLVAPGLVISNAMQTKCWVTTADAFRIFGYANRILVTTAT